MSSAEGSCILEKTDLCHVHLLIHLHCEVRTSLLYDKLWKTQDHGNFQECLVPSLRREQRWLSYMVKMYKRMATEAKMTKSEFPLEEPTEYVLHVCLVECTLSRGIPLPSSWSNRRRTSSRTFRVASLWSGNLTYAEDQIALVIFECTAEPRFRLLHDIP